MMQAAREHRCRACWRNSSSGAVSSWDESVTNSMPSAWSSAPRVMMPCAESSPPTPGVSIRQSPARRKRRGSRTSTERSPRTLPGLPVSDTQSAIASIGTGSVSGSPSGPEASK